MVSLLLWIAVVCFGLAIAKSLKAYRWHQRQRYETHLQSLEQRYAHQLLDAEKRWMAAEQERDALQSSSLDVQVQEARKLHLLEEIAALEKKRDQLLTAIEEEELHKDLVQEERHELECICENLRQYQEKLTQKNQYLDNQHYQLIEQDKAIHKYKTLEHKSSELERQCIECKKQLDSFEKEIKKQEKHQKNSCRISVISQANENLEDCQNLFYARINLEFDTVIQAVEFAEYLYDDVLEIWDSARQSAYEASNFIRPHDVYLNLQALAWFGRDYFSQNGKLGVGTHKALTHLQYVSRESDSVQNNPKLLNQRHFWHADKQKVMLEHLRVATGTGGDKSLRIYFALNSETRRVEVGHCGKHLDT